MCHAITPTSATLSKSDDSKHTNTVSTLTLYQSGREVIERIFKFVYINKRSGRSHPIMRNRYKKAALDQNDSVVRLILTKASSWTILIV